MVNMGNRMVELRFFYMTANDDESLAVFHGYYTPLHDTIFKDFSFSMYVPFMYPWYL